MYNIVVRVSNTEVYLYLKVTVRVNLKSSHSTEKNCKLYEVMDVVTNCGSHFALYMSIKSSLIYLKLTKCMFVTSQES